MLRHTTAPIFNVFITITGSASAVQFPDEKCLAARWRADPDNIGDFFVGDEQNQPYTYDADQELEWTGLMNLNQLYHSNPSGSVDYLHVWLQK